MEIVRIALEGFGQEYQIYNPKDDRLIVNNFVNGKFGTTSDVIEYYIYDTTGTLLNVSYDARNYYPTRDSIDPTTNTYSAISLDPKADIERLGYSRGSLKIQYNFLKNLFNSSVTSNYWIKDISKSRTELRLSSQDISNSGIRDGFNTYDLYSQNKTYYSDFYLNFGSNQLVIATNVLIEDDGEDEVYLLIKLYEPLPLQFEEKSTLWIVDKIAESVVFNIDIQVEAEVKTLAESSLRGPNTKIAVSDRIGQTTEYYNYNRLFSSQISSSIQQISSYYDDKAISINVDYTNFSNFIHFSSARERIENFVYKLQLIEQYQNEISSSRSITNIDTVSISYVSQSIRNASNNIDNIIKKFDTYEYYLYYESESFAWPKSNSTKPYTLFATTSSQAISWLGGEDTSPNPNNPLSASLLYSASYYDSQNNNIVTNLVPQYLQEDPNNAPMVSFMYMLAQHFDNIWLYYKDVTNKYDATNNPKTGISIDLVADALKGLGFNLYTNTNLSNNLYYSLFGINPDGSLLPPTGSELIEKNALGNRGYVTSSLTTLSANDIQKELYKRIYHNLPYIYKSKGTQRALRALIACYGIPESILEPSEFGNYQRYTKTGTNAINNTKIYIYTGNQELSQSVLSPYTTLQTNKEDSYRLGSYDVEVGFSPANTINSNIQSSSGFVNIDNLIGNPQHQYLTQYPDLESYKNTYFSTYQYPHSVWEYMRLIKYYNNSLFKTIRDYIPARANLQSGIVIKSHVLERNKFARHEPSTSIDFKFGMANYGTISGGTAMDAKLQSSWKSKINTPTGSVSRVSTQSVELYNGEFSGSLIKAINTLGYSNQKELSSNYSSSGDCVSPIYVNYGALLHNITSSVRSKRFINLDYTSNATKPVNFNIITGSFKAVLSASRNPNNAPIYCNPNYPYAELQDTNYTSRAFTDLRYYGVKTISETYNKYSPNDKSYGNTAAIDKVKNYFAYIVDIFTASVYFPKRSNAQIKYLIDSNENVLDLTKANNNIFEVQNVFKSQENLDIALFEYDEKNAYTQRLANNPTLKIYEGGYRYVPIYHNLSGSTPTASFSLVNPINFIVQESNNVFNPTDPQWKLTNYSLVSYNNIQTVNYSDEGYTEVSIGLTASYDPDATFPGSFSASLNINAPRLDGLNTEVVTVIFTPGGPTLMSASLKYVFDLSPIDPVKAALNQGLGYVSNLQIYPKEVVGNYKAYFVTDVFTTQSGIFYDTGSNQAVIKLSDSYGSEDMYKNYGLIYSSSSDLFFTSSGLDRVVKNFLIEPGDIISFKNTGSSKEPWSEKYEFTVKSVDFTGSYNEAESRLLITFDGRLPLDILKGPISTNGLDKTTKANYSSSDFIIYKHTPDETNIILQFNPTDPTIREEGLLYPQYMSKDLKRKSGNIIKSLRAQNLIQITNTNITP